MTPGQALICLISVVIALFISVRLGHRKGRVGLGWAMGLFLGWIGVIVMLCVPKTRERMVEEARVRQEIEADARRPRPEAPGVS